MKIKIESINAELTRIKQIAVEPFNPEDVAFSTDLEKYFSAQHRLLLKNLPQSKHFDLNLKHILEPTHKLKPTNE